MTEVREVALEAVNFSFVEAHAGHERAFDQWYESDHFYAGGVLAPGVLSGRRWYAPKSLRDARYVGDPCPFPDPMAGTHLATYFSTQPDGGREFLEWVGPQLVELRAQGRMFAERTPVNIAFYTFDRVVELDACASMSPHIALDHPFGAVVVTFASPGAGTAPAPVAAVPAGTFTIACAWRPLPAVVPQPDLAPYDPVTLLLTFLPDAPPADADLIASVAASASTAVEAAPLWAGAFLPVVPGSTDHLDSLR